MLKTIDSYGDEELFNHKRDLENF